MNANELTKPSVLYEDQDLLIVNKPPGLLSIQDGYDPNLPHLRSVLEPDYGSLWMVHRLDKDTSGVIMLARNAEAHRKMNASFRGRKIDKVYHGLVTPAPEWRKKDIYLPLQTNADRRHRTRVNTKSGKPAVSICQVIDHCGVGVLMEINIETGITHQIRAHLRAFDLMLLGESLYDAGLPDPPLQVARTMLHARTLAFTHPSTNDPMSITAPYLEDFREAYTLMKTTTSQDAEI